MNSAKWNWILLTILASHLILTSTADTQCCEVRQQLEEINSLVDQLLESVTSNCPEEEGMTLCNITSSDWRRVAYINMTDPGAECPRGLREVSNSTTGQRACGRAGNTTDRSVGCVSVFYPVNTSFTHVCGIARGYQDASVEAFGYAASSDKSRPRSVDEIYVDGLSITTGNPKQHIWTYIVGLQEVNYNNPGSICPRDINPYNFNSIPSYVGDHFYCETGFTNFMGNYGVVVWSDPLWDGAGCVTDTAHSCDRHGWFHREIEPIQDYIEVRWCADEQIGNEDVLVEHLEIWVL